MWYTHVDLYIAASLLHFLLTRMHFAGYLSKKMQVSTDNHLHTNALWLAVGNIPYIQVHFNPTPLSEIHMKITYNAQKLVSKPYIFIYTFSNQASLRPAFSPFTKSLILSMIQWLKTTAKILKMQGPRFNPVLEQSVSNSPSCLSSHVEMSIYLRKQGKGNWGNEDVTFPMCSEGMGSHLVQIQGLKRCRPGSRKLVA